MPLDLRVPSLGRWSARCEADDERELWDSTPPWMEDAEEEGVVLVVDIEGGFWFWGCVLLVLVILVGLAWRCDVKVVLVGDTGSEMGLLERGGEAMLCVLRGLLM